MNAQGIKLVSVFLHRQKAAGDLHPGIRVIEAKIRCRNGHGFAGDDVAYQGDGDQVHQLFSHLPGASQGAVAVGFKEVDSAADVAAALDVAHFFQLIEIVIHHRG